MEDAPIEEKRQVSGGNRITGCHRLRLGAWDSKEGCLCTGTGMDVGEVVDGCVGCVVGKSSSQAVTTITGKALAKH